MARESPKALRDESSFLVGFRELDLRPRPFILQIQLSAVLEILECYATGKGMNMIVQYTEFCARCTELLVIRYKLHGNSGEDKSCQESITPMEGLCGYRG